ncbi:hotdog family protein [Candidatus Mycalebacterium sp.]
MTKLPPSERYIGDFREGDIYHHGAVRITPVRNRQYVKKFGGEAPAANTGISAPLGYIDPDASRKEKEFGIKNPALVSRGFVFNTGFGLSVHDVSFNAIANLSYSNLVFGEPVFEGDTVSARSTVLGVEFRKNGATNGSVQVETVVLNQRGAEVLSYTRQVLVRAEKGAAYDKSSTIKPQPEKIDISKACLPPVFNPDAAPGGTGKTFEELNEGDALSGSFERGIPLADFSWLQIATLNDAAVHHTPSSVFIGYGGAVKARCEGAVSGHFPFAVQLGMNSGAHNAPTYPSDIVREIYAAGADGEHESIRARAEVAEKSEIAGRDDIGAVTIRLIGEKTVTDGGMKALEAAKFGGMDAIFEDGGKRLLRVLTLELVLAAPKRKK